MSMVGQEDSDDNKETIDTKRMACNGTLFASSGWDRSSLFMSRMVIGDIQQEDTVSLCFSGVGIAFSLWLVALGSMLIKAELTDWR
jgi:hypothetical protein